MDKSSYKAAYVSINQWAEEDRPREKLELKGKAALSDAELVAILLGSGTVSRSAVDVAKDLLHRVDNNLNSLAKLSLRELQKTSGIGRAKAITIVSALELGRRRKESEPIRRPQITCSRDAYEALRPHLLDLPVEEFWVLLMNRANHVTRTLRISEGGVSGTVADPKVIFKAALEEMASGVILAHNHPSGNLQPSEADRQLTRKLSDGGRMLDIVVLDHLIVSDHRYLSFADEGLLS
ncbi:MAG: DNA repair protein RadC [Catalinimonas sp.]